MTVVTVGILGGFHPWFFVVQKETKRLVVGCGFCTFGDPLNLQLVRMILILGIF